MPDHDAPKAATTTVPISPSGRCEIPVAHGRLEALLKLPTSGEAPRRAAVVCHPHPQHGGTMNNNVVYRMAKALEDAGTAVLRFNFRGVGRSTGSYGEGIAEAEDARAALDFLAARHPDLPLWMCGFSFGARVGLEVGAADARVERMLGAGLAVRMFDLTFLHAVRKPLAIVQAGDDELGAQAEIEAFAARLAAPHRLFMVPGASHLFPGKLDEVERAFADAIAWLDAQPPHE